MNIQTIKQLIASDKLIKFYQSRAWRTLRLKALKRDNYECQECKRQGLVYSTPVDARGVALPSDDKKENNKNNNRKSLHVHHKKEVKDYPELALVLDNLETLCQQCHNGMHDRLKDYNKKKQPFINEERW